MQEELGYDEVVDTAVDIIEATDSVVGALGDGFQITDLGTLLLVAPKAQEIARDGRTAVNQLLDLNPEESEAAVAEIARRTGKNPSKVIAYVNGGFTLLARTHRQVNSAKLLALDWVRYAKSLKPAPAA